MILTHRWRRAAGVFLAGTLVAVAFATHAATAEPMPPGAAATPAEVLAVRKLLLDGNNADAETRARAYLATTEASAGPDSPDVALALELVVEVLVGAAKAASDELVPAMLDRAQKIREATTPEGHADRALNMDLRVRVLIDGGDYDGALAMAQASLALREAAHAAPELRARSLGNIGRSLFYRQEFGKAMESDRLALQMLEAALGPDHIDTLNALNSYATDQMRGGDLPGAQRNLTRLVAAYAKRFGPEHLKTGAAYTNLAIAHKDSGDFARARPLFERAIAIKEKTLGTSHRRLAIDLQNLAVLERDLGNDAAAGPLFQRCLDILIATYGPEHPSIQNLYADLSITARRTGDLAKSRDYAERSMAIARKRGETDNPDYGVALGVLAGTLLMQGENERARDLYLETIRLMAARHGPDHAYVATMELNLASAYNRLGDFESAAPLVEHFTRVLTKEVVPQDPWYLDVMLARAEWLAASGRKNEAIALSIENTTLAREQILPNLRTLPEADALRYTASRPAGIILADALDASDIAANAEAMWNAALPARGLVLDELLARQDDARASPAVARARAAWLAANGAYARQLVVGYSDPEQRAALAAARAEVARTEAAFADASASFAVTRRRAAIRLHEISRSLPAGTALVAYWRIDATHSAERDNLGKRRRFGAFVLTGPGASPRFVGLVDDHAAQALAADWRRRVITKPGNPESDQAAKASGIALRAALWDPIAPLVKDARRILVVADGAALQVSFAALPVGDGYLVDASPPIHVIDDERDVLAEHPTRRGGLLALGGADFDLGTSAGGASVAQLRGGACRALGRAVFEPLPQSEAEANAVATLWRDRGTGRATLLTGDAATEAAFKRAASGQRVLHLATHGITSDTCDPAIAGTRAIGGDALLAPTAAPLSLYGLAVAGANARANAANADDGVLTAEELAAMDLRSAEWVVLSSCDSGRGALAENEGLLGLRRAVRIAGAGTSIMSLWPVDDDATRAWMDALYRARFVDRADTADAVWRAHRAALAARRAAGESTAPFYWGAFVASGDWR
jgi:CHAT domain-containing protein/tetratricopeptide (TPR) repeat protein